VTDVVRTPVQAAYVWTLALAARGAVACLDALLRAAPPDPGVLAIEVAYGGGEPSREMAWMRDLDIPTKRREWARTLAVVLAAQAPPDWLALVQGERQAAA